MTAEHTFTPDMDKLTGAVLYLGERSENDPHWTTNCRGCGG